MTQPTKLKQGDTVALIAPSGACDISKIDPAIATLKALGLNPIVMESCLSNNGYFAGSDTLRASDLMEAFVNPEVKGIFAFRGGYGAGRLLHLLDYDIIAKNLKVFAGYSDITALHMAFNQRCNLITYHAPMPGTELYKSDIDQFTVDSFLGNVMEERTTPKLTYTPINEHTAEGSLTGGNLSLVVASLGTPYEVDTKGKILFLEEIREEPYKIDRMFWQLKQAGKLDDCCGILLGSLSPASTESLSQTINEILLPLKKPLGVNLPCGHCLPTATLALGAQLTMKSHKGELI